jgi:two-component system NarL family sensor kinase
MQSEPQIDIYIMIGALAMFGVGMLLLAILNIYQKKIQVIENEKQLEIFKSASEAEERQKENLAKNLHDGIIPILSVVERSIDQNIKDYGTKNFDLNRLKKDLQFVEQSVENIRGISHNLIPQTLLNLGLIMALKEYVDQISDTAVSNVVFENATVYENNIPFTIPEQLEIYRICSELLMNLGKHSGYTNLKVTIENNNNNFEIVFTHNGKKITNEDIEKLSVEKKGLGLKSLKLITLILKATLNYTVENDLAFIILSVPISS